MKLRVPVLLSCLAVTAACSGPEAGPAPRVILITCDTLRADHVGVYGYPRETTPNLDAFAREGIVFEEAYATSSATNPSMVSLFTGRMPDELGATERNLRYLPAEASTLAEILSHAGIPTAAVVSNWVLRANSERPEAGVSQGFAHFDDDMKDPEPRDGKFERRAPGTTNAAIHWLEQRPGDRFFLWVHYQDPHGPYTPPERLVRDFQRSYRTKRLLRLNSINSGLKGIPKYQQLWKRRDAGFYSDRYDAEIRYFDEELGRLLGWLRDEGLYEDSLILFTADHGEALGEHDHWFSHGHALHRELVRVPFIIRYPEGAVRPTVPRDADGYRRAAVPVAHLDVWATVLEAFGLPEVPSRGTSLFTVDLPPTRMLPQILYRPLEGGWRTYLALSDGRYRLLVTGRHRGLYDIREDPGEQRNLARKRPDVVQRLESLYADFLAAVPKLELPEGPEMELEGEALEAMRALGYVDDKK